MKHLAVILALFLFIQTAQAAPLNGKAKTKRIPAGTEFTLQLNDTVSTMYSSPGTEFSAIMLNEQTNDTDVILPMGSLVRGTVKRVENAKRFSKGAVLYLDFDHVVTPTGRQLPLSMAIISRDDITYDGGLAKSKGYKDALKQNWKTLKEITKNCTLWGGDVFDDIVVADQFMTGVGAVGGAIGGSSYYAYNFFADMIKKGKDMSLYKGEVIKVILIDPIDVPVI